MVVLELDVERDEGDPVGIQVDSRLTVTKVAPGTLADGQLVVGDIILTVNGNKLRDRDDYFHKLRFAHPRLTLTYQRGSPDAAAPAPPAAAPPAARPGPGAQSPVPVFISAKPTDPKTDAELERMGLRRRPGFEYSVVEIDAVQDKRPLGLFLATRNHRVIVSNTKPGTVAADKVEVLDRFLAVNGKPVSDKEVAKAIIVQSEGKFTALVERPVTEDAKKEHRPQSGGTGTGASGDIAGNTAILPTDVLEFTKSWRETLRSDAPRPGTGILKTPGGAALGRKDSKVDVSNQPHKQHDIPREVPEWKRLRPAPRIG